VSSSARNQEDEGELLMVEGLTVTTRRRMCYIFSATVSQPSELSDQSTSHPNAAASANRLQNQEPADAD
jgi:hypothetical protein